MPTTQPTISSYLTAPLNASLGYARLLVTDIPAESFAHMPHPTMNHPAFCLGHLSLYPNQVFRLIGRSDLMTEKPGFAELFDAKATCVQQDGRYPGKDEIVDHFFDRYQAAADALESTPEDVFQLVNPSGGRLGELFPTVGAAVNFLVTSHLMVHLGQISAWRRAMGMGSAM